MKKYDKILMGLGLAFLVFCVFSVLFGEATAIWIFRISVVFVLLFSLVGLFFAGRIKWELWQERERIRAKKEWLALQEKEAELFRKKVRIQSTGDGGVFLLDFTKERPAVVPLGSEKKKTTVPARYRPKTMPVLKIMEKALTTIIIGPQGTGKTTLLQHLIQKNRLKGETVIVDPHGYIGKYPVDVHITGSGRKYDEINQQFQSVIATLNARYEQYEDQEFSLIFIYVDELTLLNEKVPIFQEFMRIMLTESRKVGIRLVACVHSDRVQFLGLERAGDLADGVTWVRLRKSQSGERWADVSLPDGEEIHCSLPGPFKMPNILGPPEKRLLEYIKKNSPVRRHKILASRLFDSGAEYDLALQKLIESSRIAVEEKPRKNDWIYTILPS